MKKLLFIFLMFSQLFAQSIETILDQQDNTISEIEKQINYMKNEIEMLKYDNYNLVSYNDNMQILIKSCDEKIGQLEDNIVKLRLALQSNKEDTSVAISELGELQSMIDDFKKEVAIYKAQYKMTNKIVQTMIPLTTIPMICGGAYLYFNSNEKELGKTFMIGGACLFVSCELVWNGKNLIFRFK